MALLSSFLFTNNARRGDLATASSDPITGGWQNTSSIGTLAGDDTIQAIGVFADLNTVTYGSVTVAGVAQAYNAAIANGGSGVIDMGAGKDILSGTTSGLRSIGILNGKVGSTTATSARIAMGAGDDEIHGINVSASNANTYGIYNTGVIDLGAGNDVIQGIKSSTAASGAAIYNVGTIIGGLGNDEFDAMQGGWAGTGTVDCGAGDDVVTGFGSGNFNGGAGLKDELILPAGTYAITYNAIPTATTANFKLTKDGNTSVVMNLVGFEGIGSIDPLAGIHPTATDGLRPTAFTIDALGAFTSVTFVAATSAI
jgi:hypothetical protein